MPELIAKLKSCSRCGAEFLGYPFEHSCHECLTMKASPRLPALGQRLTFRENQLCKLISEGNGNKEIATRLHLSTGTVKEYNNRMFKKLGANNRTHAVMIWLGRMREQEPRNLAGSITTAEHGPQIVQTQNMEAATGTLTAGLPATNELPPHLQV